jgi:hypothetical protein
MFFGPLGDLGALGVMSGLSHTWDAKSAKNGDVVGGRFTTLPPTLLCVLSDLCGGGPALR